MLESLLALAENNNMPMVSAFVLGVLTSISPCPLATNITAVAYISREIKTPRYTLLSGLFYTLGRGISYTALAVLIYFGLSSFQVSRIFQGWGDKVLGPILIVLGLVMFGVIKVDTKLGGRTFEALKTRLADKGHLGALALGSLFAFALCPYSGVMFFGVLIPLIMKTPGGLILPPIFAIGTGLPVLVFSLIIAFSARAVGRAFQAVQKTEKWLRYGVSATFILAGVYYLQFPVRALIMSL